MCDEIDAAAELELLNVEIALKNRQRPAIEFTGKCHYCEETISKGITAMQGAEKTMSACSGHRSRGLLHEYGF